MTYVRFEAVPSGENPELGQVGGAFVNCWVNTNDLVEAEETARRWVLAEGWLVSTVEECRLVDAETPRVGESAQSIAEARVHGGSIVFHRWPKRGERNG
jgi:hypothetical protein